LRERVGVVVAQESVV